MGSQDFILLASDSTNIFTTERSKSSGIDGFESGTEMMVHELAYVPKPRTQTFTGFYTIHIYDGKHEAIKGDDFQK